MLLQHCRLHPGTDDAPVPNLCIVCGGLGAIAKPAERRLAPQERKTLPECRFGKEGMGSGAYQLYVGASSSMRGSSWWWAR